ncbi:neutral zinc metallopeptidase [Kitasatospora sp. NE20-6]|uniref:neutral zinc metallopeptidase n=1 Tax=Kitasatospora sp. NE20-6 TaxID=2859066 RepID=UPI0038B2BF98
MSARARSASPAAPRRAPGRAPRRRCSSRAGRIDPERRTHGSAEQRKAWFTAGHRGGDPDRCDTFAQGRPPHRPAAARTNCHVRVI